MICSLSLRLLYTCDALFPPPPLALYLRHRAGDQFIGVASDTFDSLRVTRVDNPSCVNFMRRASAGAGGTGGSTQSSSDSPRGNGAFDGSGTPTTMSSQTGTYQPDSSHTAKYGVMRTSATDKSFNIWLVIEPLGNSNASLTYADVHYVAPVNGAEAVMAAPLNKQMVVQDGATRRTYRHGPIPLADGKSIRFSFTYSITGGKLVDTPTYVFSASASSTMTVMPGSTGSGTGSGSGSGCTPVCAPGAPGPDVRRLYRFLGKYTIDASRCTSSSSCCCGIGNIVATEVPGDTAKVRLSGSLDGSSGTCNACAMLCICGVEYYMTL